MHTIIFWIFTNGKAVALIYLSEEDCYILYTPICTKSKNTY